MGNCSGHSKKQNRNSNKPISREEYDRIETNATADRILTEVSHGVEGKPTLHDHSIEENPMYEKMTRAIKEMVKKKEHEEFRLKVNREMSVVFERKMKDLVEKEKLERQEKLEHL